MEQTVMAAVHNGNCRVMSHCLRACPRRTADDNIGLRHAILLLSLLIEHVVSISDVTVESFGIN